MSSALAESASGLHIGTGLANVVAVVALLIALLSALYTRRSSNAAVRSSNAAVQIAAHDADRRHDEREPRYRVSAEQDRTTADRWWLRLVLESPIDVDTLTISIETDVALDQQAVHWLYQVPGGEPAEAVVHDGPLRRGHEAKWLWPSKRTRIGLLRRRTQPS